MKIISTKQRNIIAEEAEAGNLMLVFGYNRKKSVAHKHGKKISQGVAEEMLKRGWLVPNGNDGLFVGCSQTLKLSSTYSKQ